MKVLVDRILLVLLFVVISAATVTAAIPAVSGDHLGGLLLLAHMFSSGGLVFLLPIFALFWLFPCISRWVVDAL